MRKVLAITVVLMLAAIVLSPAMGYTIKSEGNQSYSIQSSKVNYSISSGTPAHEITPSMIPPEVAPTAAVTVTRVPYSIKLGQAAPYSVKLASNVTPAVQGVQITPQTAVLGAAAPKPVTTPSSATPVETLASQLNVSAPANVTTPAKTTFSIMGAVFDDTNGNGIKDTGETGLAGWMVNLEQPSGAVITNTTTTESGDYAFNGLNAGTYVVSEVLPMGWSIVVPAEGKYTANLTNADIMNLNFANKKVPPENVTLPVNATENLTMPVNATAPA